MLSCQSSTVMSTNVCRPRTPDVGDGEIDAPERGRSLPTNRSTAPSPRAVLSSMMQSTAPASRCPFTTTLMPSAVRAGAMARPM